MSKLLYLIIYIRKTADFLRNIFLLVQVVCNLYQSTRFSSL